MPGHVTGRTVRAGTMPMYSIMPMQVAGLNVRARGGIMA